MAHSLRAVGSKGAGRAIGCDDDPVPGRRSRLFLVESVLSMLRNPPERNPLAEFYQGKKQEKGAGKAICATARKLLTVLHVMRTKDVEYWYLEDRLYQKKLKALGAAA